MLKKNRINCHDYYPISNSEVPTLRLPEYKSRNSHSVVFLKIQLYVKVALYLKTIGCFVSAKGLCIIIRLNSRLLPFAKFLELLNSSSVKAG